LSYGSLMRYLSSITSGQAKDKEITVKVISHYGDEVLKVFAF